jgi:hypothetical protein
MPNKDNLNFLCTEVDAYGGTETGLTLPPIDFLFVCLKHVYNIGSLRLISLNQTLRRLRHGLAITTKSQQINKVYVLHQSPFPRPLGSRSTG